MKHIKNIFTLWNIISAIIGGLGGFAYYYFVGCSSGTCPLTSRPFPAIAWGMVFGYLLGDLIKPIFIRKKKGEEEQQ